MSFNTFGHLFRFTTWGESHGPALGVVVDGCPPGLMLTPEMIQRDLDRRKPGQSKYTTQRREADEVKILSGVFEDERTDGPRTTGTPISLMIENTDQRSKDYAGIGRAMPIIPMTRNTASGTTAAAGAPRPVRQRRGWRQARWHDRCWRV
jgi:chorismate synthase